MTALATTLCMGTSQTGAQTVEKQSHPRRKQRPSQTRCTACFGRWPPSSPFRIQSRVLGWQKVALDHQTFRIQNAARVRWEWFYYGRPKTDQNRYFMDFTRTVHRIDAQNNVDWCTLTLQRPLSPLLRGRIGLLLQMHHSGPVAFRHQ